MTKNCHQTRFNVETPYLVKAIYKKLCNAIHSNKKLDAFHPTQEIWQGYSNGHLSYYRIARKGNMYRLKGKK
jgi:hypothetical protein